MAYIRLGTTEGGMFLRPQKRLVRFGVFEFDPASGDLWKAGRRVKLQNQPRQVLTTLVARRGELVTREELRRELWPGHTFVDFDNGLNVAIRKIRDVLGDAAPSPRFIETERARGYRFIAEISHDPLAPGSDAAIPPVAMEPREPPRVEDAAPQAHRERSAGVVAALAALLVAGIATVLWHTLPDSASPAEPDSRGPISLAVLPFSSSGERDDFLGAGIADGIVTRLSNVRQFRVRPAAGAARDAEHADAQEVGRRLGSQYVLAGTIRTVDNAVRVSAQLVRARDGSPIWGQHYDAARGDLLGLEDAIAERIASALRIRMTDDERDRVYRRYTESGAAYERYLMGRSRLRSLSEQNALQAIVEFERAVDLDPNYALAYAGIASAAAQLRVRFASREGADVWDARARTEAGRALQLDPDLSEAHVALAAVHRFQEFDWDTVIRESRRAIDLNPALDVPYLYLAVAYFHIGLLDEAESAVTAALDLNPENQMEASEILGAIRLFAGRAGDAAGHLLRAQEVSDSRIVKYLLGWSLYYEGERQRAETMLAAIAGDEGPVAGNARATLAAIQIARGARPQGRALADAVATEDDLIHHGAYGLGTAYAQLRDSAMAIRWLSRAAATGFSCYPWYERDPLLDPIRSDPRFSLFMRDLRRSWLSARARYGNRASH